MYMEMYFFKCSSSVLVANVCVVRAPVQKCRLSMW